MYVFVLYQKDCKSIKELLSRFDLYTYMILFKSCSKKDNYIVYFTIIEAIKVILAFIEVVREATKSSFFSGPATKRGGG